MFACTYLVDDLIISKDLYVIEEARKEGGSRIVESVVGAGLTLLRDKLQPLQRRDSFSDLTFVIGRLNSSNLERNKMLSAVSPRT